MATEKKKKKFLMPGGEELLTMGQALLAAPAHFTAAAVGQVGHMCLY